MKSNDELPSSFLIFFLAVFGCLMHDLAAQWDWTPGKWGLFGVWAFFALLMLALKYGQPDVGEGEAGEDW